MSSWSEKIKAGGQDSAQFTFAPAWYIEAKKSGKTPEEIFVMVREFCQKETVEPGKKVDDTLVALMIETYEA